MKSALELFVAAQAVDQIGHGTSGGAPPPFGFMLSQKNVWFQTLRRVVEHGARARLDDLDRALRLFGLPAIRPFRVVA
jgi:hypothetical protein